jgi:hypothetical protein
MSQGTVFVVTRGENHEGATIVAVFSTHARAVQHVLVAMIPRIKAMHPEGWKIADHLRGRPCMECGTITPPEPLPCFWTCGIDEIAIEAWPVNP